MPMKTSGYEPGATPAPIFILNDALESVVVIGSAGFALMPPAGSGGVTVTLPVNPPIRLMFTVTRAFVPACADTVDESKPSEKSGVGGVGAMS